MEDLIAARSKRPLHLHNLRVRRTGFLGLFAVDFVVAHPVFGGKGFTLGILPHDRSGGDPFLLALCERKIRVLYPIRRMIQIA